MGLKYILIACILLFFSNVRAQKELKTLSIGDSLPDLIFNKLINSNQQALRTVNFKNKLLIIDFWATNCPGCVAALPGFDSLQRRFGNLIKILPVTDESKMIALKFWKNNKYTKKIHLSSVVEDKILSSYFLHKTIPHEVWIYKGRVIGITSSEYVDAFHIQQILNGSKINWPLKYDFYSFNASKQSLFNLDSNQIDEQSTAVKYAAICDYKEKVNSEGFSGGSGIVRDAKNKTIRAYFLNQSIFVSYIQNLGKIIKMDSLIKPSLYQIQPNQIIWEVSEKSKYKYESKLGYTQDWIRIHGICFESMNPDTGQTDIMVYQTIINDLNRLLGLRVRWEKRKEKILKLVITSKSKLLAKHNAHYYSSSNFLQNLVYQLNQQEGNPYVFDESEYTKEVNFNLNFSSLTDIESIRKVIRTYGLDLLEEERLVDKLIFTEVNGGKVLDSKMMDDAKMRKIISIQHARKINTTENKTFLENNKIQSGVKVTSSGLQYKIVKTGTGPKPTEKEKVRIQYTGMLVNGQIFESSFENGKPFDTQITDLIPGWKEALTMMNLGAKWILYIPAELAYNERTMHGKIPPNSTLIIELKLVEIIK